MNMEITTKNITISIISLITLLFLLPQTSLAYRAVHPESRIGVLCTACDAFAEETNFTGIGFLGKISYTVSSQDFNMIRSDTGKNLTKVASIPVGVNLKYISNSPAVGTWFLTGGGYDSPDMNSKIHIAKFSERLNFIIKGYTPRNNPPSSIVGSGAVSCNGNICNTTRTGAASITLTFSGDQATFELLQIRYYRTTKYLDSVNSPYSGTSFTYNFDVYQPNIKPVLTSCSASNISYTSGRINWSYSDPDGDRQSKAYVQVAREASFSPSSLVVNRVINGSQNNTDITSGLSHSTRYYFRVKANDGKVDGDWRNCGNFQTLVNRAHTINLTSVSAATTSPAKYTTAVINWTYSDPENDKQESVDIQVSTDPSFPDNNGIERYRGTGTSYTIRGLLPGETYYVRVRAENGPNGWSGWTSPPRSVTMDNYPEPKFSFDLKSSTNTVVPPNTLTVQTGDSVNANWSVTDTVGVSSCKVETTGGDGTKLFESTEFSGALNQIAPNNPRDLEYQVKLTCAGKPAKIVRNISQTITLIVESYPTVSCSIENNKRSVQEGDSNITIKATVGNVNSYTWKIGRGINDTNPINSNGATSNLNLTQNLSYVGLDFGRYSPWIEVTKSGGDNRTTGKKSCGTITNFGSSTIREVNP